MPYTASMRTPITRERKASPAAPRSVTFIEIIATFWKKPAVSSVRTPAPRCWRRPKPSSSAYQIAVHTSVVRSGRRGVPLSTIVRDASRPPNAKLATSHPSPVAST